MAVVKLGMLVSEIRGSIGGTTFRKNGTSLIMQNKQAGISKNKQLKNSKLLEITNFIRFWTTLNPVAQSNWFDLAQSYQVLDKFGNLKYLKSREMFLKLACACDLVNLPIPNPLDANNIIYVKPVISYQFSLTNGFYLEFEDYVPETYVLLQISQITNLGNSVTYNRQKFAVAELLNLDALLDFSLVISELFPFLKVGDYLRVVITFQNKYGFRAVKTSVQYAVTI